ncbi:iron/manganese ABC transporter permease subunit YfeD [Providencia sp.]
MSDFIDLLMAPFAFPFMQKALITAIVSGTVCAILSCFLVLKGWSLMGDAYFYAVLPGIIASLLGIPLAIGAFASGLFCAVATGYLKENSRIKEDTVMGIVFSGMFAVGLVMFAKIDTEQHLTHILFGDILGITDSEFKQILLFAGITIAIILLKRKDFIMLYCFDSNQARVIGLPVKLIHYGLLSLLALTIVASLQAVGIILVIAMLISPGIIAFVLCRSFGKMLIVAIIASVTSRVMALIFKFP